MKISFTYIDASTEKGLFVEEKIDKSISNFPSFSRFFFFFNIYMHRRESKTCETFARPWMLKKRKKGKKMAHDKTIWCRNSRG